MKIYVYNEQSDLRINKNQVKALTKEVILHEKQYCDEVSIHLVNKIKISQLHDRYFGEPTPTDCISFPLDFEEDLQPYRILGEIFVCPEVSIEYGNKHRIDPYRETTLYIVHGLLHLIGYDDISAYDRRKMRQAEKVNMNNLETKKLILYSKTKCGVF